MVNQKCLNFQIIMWILIILEIIYAYPANEEFSDYDNAPGKVATNCSCGLSNEGVTNRIFGGTEASPHEWPMIAGLMDKTVNNKTKVLFCGGTLITRRHVITAGHCVHTRNGVLLEPHELFIVLGEYKFSQIDTDNPEILRNVEKFIPHPKFKPPAVFDLAVIVLEKLVEFSSKISPACLPTKRINPLGKKLIAAGWGFMDFKASRPDILQNVMITVAPPPVCINAYKEFDIMEGYQFCTFQGGSKGQCVGDSGGPILWRDPDTNRLTLVASPSFGKASCVTKPAVVSDISYYIPWIQKIISETYPEERTCAKIE